MASQGMRLAFFVMALAADQTCALQFIWAPDVRAHRILISPGAPAPLWCAAIRDLRMLPFVPMVRGKFALRHV